MSATREEIVAILMDESFTKAERQLVECQFPNVCHPSNFVVKLFKLLYACDESNLSRLELAYPSHVQAVRNWYYGDLAERIREKGCDV